MVLQMKKIAALLVALTVLLAGTVPAVAAGMVYPPPPFEADLQAKAIYMVNIDSGTAVYEPTAQVRVQPGFMTQIMTAIVVLEEVEEPQYVKVALKSYIQNELFNANDTTYGGIYLGDELSVYDLLHAMMLQNVNTAAMMLADHVGDGSIEYFCELMNQKAREIGAMNTNFTNATGLYDETSYTTAYDMALIAQYAMEIPLFEEIVIKLKHTSEPTTHTPQGISWISNNEMQKSSSTDYYYEGLRGIKAGTIEGVGRSFISVATRDGYTYLLVVLGAPVENMDGLRYEKNQAWVYAKGLYDWAFEAFTVKTLMNVGDTVTDIGVRLSWDVERIGLLAADKFASLVPNEVTEDSLTTDIVIFDYIEKPIKGQKGKFERFISAPIEKGQEIGYVKLVLAGEEVGRIPLVASQSVEQSLFLYYLDKVQSVFNTFWFKFIVVFIIVTIALYIALMIVRNRNKRRYASRRKGGGKPK